MEKFLKKYYKQLHFNSMPASVRNQFMEWVKNDTLTDDMKLWLRDYMHKDINTDQYVQNELPDTQIDLSNDDIRNLFITFQSALAGMSADLNTFKDKEPRSAEFVKKYFGDGKLFNISPATKECEDGIEAVLEKIQKNPELKRYIIKQEVNGKKLFESDDKFNEFIIKCKNKEYNKKADLQDKIKKIASVLESARLSSLSDEFQEKLPDADSLNAIIDEKAFAMSPEAIDDGALRDFQEVYAKAPHNPENGHYGLLQTLYFDKTIRNRFANYDNGTITGKIEKAENTINWQDASHDNYIPEKISDTLKPAQKLEKWLGDTYADSFKKYEELRGGALFFSQTSKDLFKAIDKAKIKPSDGLNTLLEKSADIEGHINNPVSRTHFKWFTETMGPIAKKMPKAVAGAWKNATQMKAIIEQIILKATDPRNDDPHAMEKAKTAMEIMTAMKYGMTTSKIMDALKNEEFEIFSDKNLSWNKDEGIQFVTKALDKSVKAAFLGIGYGITFVHNKIVLSGGKFKDKDNKKGVLAESFTQGNGYDALNNADKRRMEAANIADRDKIAKNNVTLTDLSQQGVNATYVANKKHTISGLEQDMANYEREKNKNEKGYNAYNVAKETIDNDTKLQTEKQKASNTIASLNTEINDLQAKLNNPQTYNGMPQAYASVFAMQLQNKLAKKQQELDNTNTQLKDIAAALTAPEYHQELTNANNTIHDPITIDAHDSYVKADKEYTLAKQKHDDIQDKINQFENATKEIQELNAAINERNQALATWPAPAKNKVVELENFWNFLQTGQNKTWKLSLKKAQKNFDVNKQNMLQQYISQRGLAA